MNKIKTSHIIYFFILLFPLSNFLLPFLVYGNDMYIRIYLEGSFYDHTPIENATFDEKGIYSTDKPQGIEHKINPFNIYQSIIFFLIFLLVSVFIFIFKNKNLSYDINFFKESKIKYFLLLLFFLVLVYVIDYYKLKNYSNFFINLSIVTKIFVLLFSSLFLFSSKNIKEVFFSILLVFLSLILIVETRHSSNIPMTYSLIFNIYFLLFILITFLALKKKITFVNTIIIFLISCLILLFSFLWKENIKSYSNYNWNKLSKKIHINTINKPFGSESILGSVISIPLTRINKLDQFSYILEKKDDFKLLLGESYIPLLTKFIPRQLWKNKPEETFGNKYGRDYRLIPPYDFTTSVGASTIIEAYINFRIPGLIFLAIFYGLLFRILNFFIYKYRENNIYSSFLFIIISIFISLTSESNLSSGLGGVIHIAIIIIAFNIYTITKNKMNV
tara:strand:+ start:215 stop:1552 length:1338 start_codon:yes stop_codon:yes gene_type:complete